MKWAGMSFPYARIFCVLALLMLASCGTYYNDVPTAQSHATLQFVGSWGLLRAQTTVPMSINGVPSNGGRGTLRKFRIQPGQTVVALHTAQDGFHRAESEVTFMAVVGRTYTITDKKDGDFIEIAVTDDTGLLVASARPKNVPFQPRHEYYGPY